MQSNDSKTAELAKYESGTWNINDCHLFKFCKNPPIFAQMKPALYSAASAALFGKAHELCVALK